MEHGNALNANQEVDVVLKPEPHGLTVEIFDSGGGFEAERKEMPDVERKIRGEESTGGLGLFLIEQLVDSVEYEVVPEVGHVTRLRITNVKTEPMPQVITSQG
jgi:anti-sigma regulatory factor (Ser/Thr protein kinase)